ncbi:related to CSL4-exosome core component [Serendipita indica DSM 11827]|uniref:Related to CSL4-exosome core component n=1 Tax=Serendipita indica (strain DSM 11827) TaxID=1109443 RepID=G4T956_SERID|nr:related to CSL4-exosome core component [Serendipita indica DSM 11827]
MANRRRGNGDEENPNGEGIQVCSSQMSLVLPGQPLSASTKAGDGVYMDANGVSRASLIATFKNDSVQVPKGRASAPSENAIVIGTVVRLNSQQATISITIVNGVPLPQGDEYVGIIRSQDVRATEKDKVKIGDCFRGGDIVAGQVISLGDSRSYYVSTAHNDLGVLYATSSSGYPMEPYSWESMYCPQDQSIEPRKCARPTVDYSQLQLRP